MIALTLSTVIGNINVQIEGEANDLEDIREAWESFILSTYQVEYGTRPGSFRDLRIHQKNLTHPPVMEVL